MNTEVENGDIPPNITTGGSPQQSETSFMENLYRQRRRQDPIHSTMETYVCCLPSPLSLASQHLNRRPVQDAVPPI
ncbi:hypothetical protein NPIL_440081 [Nephila pilipes]|uniref:Uncharacterized protein n=1 Tax=Nephila pilipes TaxID=299642 RepID=A0A8X6MJQ6_NEPPI|nr:hypothetical protein NPIL_440081 [Nephila pilipes]